MNLHLYTGGTTHFEVVVTPRLWSLHLIHIDTYYTHMRVDTKEPGSRNHRAGIYELQNQIYIFMYYTMYYLAILNSTHLYRV